jgi:hypothetical protein
LTAEPEKEKKEKRKRDDVFSLVVLEYSMGVINLQKFDEMLDFAFYCGEQQLYSPGEMSHLTKST